MVGQIIGDSAADVQSATDITILLTDDLVLDVADPDHWLAGGASLPAASRHRESPGLRTCA